MKLKIIDLMSQLINDGSGLFELDDLNAYVDKLIEKACLLTIIEQDVLKGLLAYYANDYENKVAFLSMLIISPSARRMGYGRRLVEFVFTELTLKGFKKCCTEVKEDNIKALTVCKKLGFTSAGTKNGYMVLEKLL
ncbi:GNAT family N-acetyltransferase [Mucilaginibacter lappiensis]|jgi:ribosomal protein S18 acetylase RimI-like enzyme|uniref:GNAT family N-acetyltransferase n=1 Tax=Mucilaginibacter lappiensis TaxID=354630 RepID=UPI003D22EE0C